MFVRGSIISGEYTGRRFRSLRAASIETANYLSLEALRRSLERGSRVVASQRNVTGSLTGKRVT